MPVRVRHMTCLVNLPRVAREQAVGHVTQARRSE